MKSGWRRMLWLLPGILLMVPFALGLRTGAKDPDNLGYQRIGIPGVGYAYKDVKAPVRYAPDRILVRFKENVPDEQIQALHRQLGTEVIIQSHYIPKLQAVRLPKGMSVKEAILAFERSGLVKYAEPDFEVHILTHPNYPNDPFAQMYEDTSVGTPGCDPADAGAEDSTWWTYAWDTQMGTQCTYLDNLICSGYTCSGANVSATDMNVLPCDDMMSCDPTEPEGAFTDVTPVGVGPDPIVLVIDTGVDYLHQDVAANMWQNPGEIPANGLDDDNNGIIDDVYGIRTIGLGGEGFPECGSSNAFGDPMDDHGHGTHVASTVAARVNNFAGIVGIGSGVNNRIKVAACKFLNTEGTGFTSDAIVCLEYAAWMKDQGYNIIATNNSWGGGGFSQALMDAIALNRDKGILFIAAAGNSTADNDMSAFYPSNYDVDNIIAVASYNQHDCMSGFSNWGARSVDIAAPGSAILGACTTGGCSGTPGAGVYAWFWGTSMASPHVAGLAALLKAINPNLEWWQIRNIILSTGTASSRADTDCSSLAEDVDGNVGLFPTFQSYTGTAPDMKKTVTDARVNALRAAQVAAMGSGPGDYDVQARLWPYGDAAMPRTAYLNLPTRIKAINVNGWNVGAPGSVQIDVTYTPLPPPGTVVLSEDFSTGDPPTGWTVVNGPSHTCAEDWTTTNPGGRAPGAPFVDPFEIADSDAYGFGCRIQSELRTPMLDLTASGCTIPGDIVLLSFSNWYRNLGETVTIDVSADGGATWTNLVTWTSSVDYPTPGTQVFDITSLVGSGTQVMVRWVYDDGGGWNWYWAIDNVQIECVSAPPPPQACGPVDCRDDGVFPDQVAGDGIFICEFTPGQPIGTCASTGAGTYDVTLTFDGTPYETLTYNVPDVASGAYDFYGACPATTAPLTTDICSTGTVVLSGSDDGEAGFTTVGAYMFGGATYTDWCVGSNGVIVPGVTTCSVPFSNDVLPSSSFTQAIAPYWDDLYGVSPTGTVVYEEVPAGDPRNATGEDLLVVAWCNYSHFDGDRTGNWVFQAAVGSTSGKLWYQYFSTTGEGPEFDWGASATVGVQTSPLAANMFSFNAPAVPDGTVLEWSFFSMTGRPQPLPGSVNFAFVPVGGSKSYTIRIRNTGFADLNILNVTGPSTPDFSFTGFSASVIPPGQEVSGVVTFNPTTGGTLADAILVETDGGCVSFGLQGTGVGPYPDIHLPSAVIDFGTVIWGHIGGASLPVQNLGASDLMISGVDNSLAPTVSVTTTLPLTIAPSSSDILSFAWDSSNGCIDSRVRIVSNDPDEPSPQVRVLGRTSVADVPSGIAYFVERLVANGITSGCGTEATIYGVDLNSDGDQIDKVFCPARRISRAQMAIMVARALAGKLNDTITNHGLTANCDGDPATSTPPQFTDIPDANTVLCHAVYYLVDKGIVSGCTPTQFCPNNKVNRAQMAIFVAKSMEFPGAVPSYDGIYCGPTGTSQFTDVANTSFICRYVHHIWVRGVTAGCTTTEFCPTALINRAQTAIFLQKAFALQCR